MPLVTSARLQSVAFSVANEKREEQDESTADSINQLKYNAGSVEQNVREIKDDDTGDSSIGCTINDSCSNRGLNLSLVLHLER